MDFDTDINVNNDILVGFPVDLTKLKLEELGMVTEDYEKCKEAAKKFSCKYKFDSCTSDVLVPEVESKQAGDSVVMKRQRTSSSCLSVDVTGVMQRRSGWTNHGFGLRGGGGEDESLIDASTSKVADLKFADSDDEFGPSTSVLFANDSSEISDEDRNNKDEKAKSGMSALPNTLFLKMKTNQFPKAFKFNVIKHCSKICGNKCEKVIESWSNEKVMEMKSDLKGSSSTESKNKLLKHLRDQMKFNDTTGARALLYRGHLFCKSFLAYFLDLSYYLVKTVFKDWEAGRVQYVNGNVENIRESQATVNCISWFLVHIAIHGQDSPEELLTVLPSYMTKAELYRTYLQETTGKQLKKSCFYEIFKSKFGPRRQERTLPQVRISKYSSHSVCDVCLGLDNFQRTCKSQAQIKFCQGLKQNHKIKYGNARVEIGRLKQLGITFPKEWMTFQIDGMDNQKSTIPRILEKGKKLAGLFRLPCKISGGIIWSSLYPGHRKNKFFINHDHFPNSSNMVVTIVFLMLKDVLADHKFLPKCLHINLDNCGLLFMHIIIFINTVFI